MLEPDVVQEEGAVDIDQEHPLETTLAAPRRLKLLQSTCPVYRCTPEQDREYLPKSLPLLGIRKQLEWHSITGLCLDRSPGACLRLAVSARHEDGLVKVIDLPQLIRSSVGCRDAVTPEEYYHDDSRWQMEIEKSVINSNTNLPTGTKIVPSERTRFLIGESSAANHLGSGLPLRPDCRLYAKDVMLLSLGIDWPIGNNITGLFDRINHDTVSDDEPLPVSNSLTAHPTASVFASATNSGVRVWSFGCPALDEPARPLCLFESPKRPSFRDTLRVASWSDDGGMLAGISKKGRMSVWSSCRPGKPIISFNSPFIRGNDVKALTPSGSLMLICGRQSPSGSGGAAMVDCRSPELVVQKWNAGPGLEYTCASGLSQPQELQLGTCDGRVVDLDTRAGGRSKTVMFYGDDHDRSPAIHSLLRYGTDQDGIVAVTHGSAVGVLQAGKDAGSFDSEYTMHKGGMKSAVKAAFSKIGPKLVAAADACGIWMSFYVRKSKLFPLGCALACGVLLAAGFTHSLPDGVEHLEAWSQDNLNGYPFAYLLCGITIAFLAFFEEGVQLCFRPKPRPPPEESSSKNVRAGEQILNHHAHPGNLTKTSALFVFLALSLHSILEGMATGVATGVSNLYGTVIAILAHKGLAAFALGASMVEANVASRTVLLYGTIFAVVTPVGIMVGWLGGLAEDSSGIFGGVAYALVAGTFIYVSIVEFMPIVFGLNGVNFLMKATVAPSGVVNTVSFQVIMFLAGFSSMAVLAILI
ncbi:Dmx-like 1 [Perkinsus olseni]|uniref:Dmx-like 1 n=1 Tax=Perkinsus olseni TaxID=32597 RepID=A0A7J6TBA3_PEROL|nr:Dmx-like 1 [Perkinsus olseni]